jgi:ferrochelatase
VNERPDWIAALRDLVSTHLAGWPVSAQTDMAAGTRAKALGAKT